MDSVFTFGLPSICDSARASCRPRLRTWVLRSLLMLLLIGFAPSASLAAEAESALIPSIRRIQERGELLIGIPPYNTPPFYYRTAPDRDLQGYDIDIGRSIARRLGVRPVFDQRSTSFNDLVVRAGRGEVDLAIGKLGTTYPRLFDAQPHAYMRFRQALLINRQVLSRIGRESDPQLGIRLQEAPIRIGVIQKSAYDTFVKDVFPKASVMLFKDWPATVQALKSGDVDAIYRDSNEIRMLTLQDPRLALRYIDVIIDDMIDVKSMFVGNASEDLGPFIDFLVSSEFGIPDDKQIMKKFQSFYRRQG